MVVGGDGEGFGAGFGVGFDGVGFDGVGDVGVGDDDPDAADGAGELTGWETNDGPWRRAA